MKIQISDENQYYAQQVSSFVNSARAIGISTEEVTPRDAKARSADPGTYIAIQIDPETLRSIFEYVGALLVTYKSADYFGDAFKAAVKKLGENVGARLGEAFSSLWEGLIDRIRELHATKKHTRVYISITAE